MEIEIQNLKEMNKKLLIENNTTPSSFGDVHSFYQDLVVVDFKKEIEEY